MNTKPITSFFCATTTLAVLVGCGGSGTDSSNINPVTKAQARFVNSMPTPVSYKVDGTTVAGPSGYASVTSYLNFTPGSRDIKVVDATNTVLSDSIVDMLSSKPYTAVAFSDGTTSALLVLPEGSPIPSVQAGIRFAKVGGSTSTSDDLYITAPGADISALTPAFSGVIMGHVPQGYAMLGPGTYEIRQTANGSKTPILDQQFTLTAGSANTVLDAGGSAFIKLTDK